MSSEILHRTNDSKIDELEALILEQEQIVCPLEHRFTDGMYIREITMAAGSLITSKIHRTEHPFTISKGRVMVCIDAGDWVEYEAPYTGITQSGTRRVLYVVEDCVWTTYHLNPSNTQDLKEIEDRIIGTAVAGALTGIASAIANTKDMNQRRKFVQNLAALDYDQKVILNKQLIEANSEAARQQILGDTLGKLDVARIEALGKVQAEKEKTKKSLYIVAGIGGLIIVGGLVAIKLKKD